MSKRRRPEGAVLSAQQLGELTRAHDMIAKLASGAPDVPQLAEMLELSTALLGQQHGAVPAAAVPPTAGCFGFFDSAAEATTAAASLAVAAAAAAAAAVPAAMASSSLPARLV